MRSIIASVAAALFLWSEPTLALPSQAPTILTTSGRLVGVQQDGVNIFKGIRYAQPPTGVLRWESPIPFASIERHDSSQFGAACFQAFDPEQKAVVDILFNSPPPAAESDDCLFLNVWAPATPSLEKRPVIFWIHGGALAFGSGELPLYDGASFAKNQDVIVVTINYRTNIFGFPFSPDPDEIAVRHHNVGLEDQELALLWTQLNIEAFGGDRHRVALMGQSAGASSITWLLNRHSIAPPFQSAIMFSSAFLGEATPVLNGTTWDSFAAAVGCTGPSGRQRLACLKQVPAQTISDFVNAGGVTVFNAFVDNSTVFFNPLERIRLKQTARVPILQGSMQDDGSVFVLNQVSLPGFLDSLFHGAITTATVAPLYPGLRGRAETARIERDLAFSCPASLHATAYAQSGIQTFRYTYGAVFDDLEILPGLGAWHSSELGEVFGTFNPQTATPDEVTLSHTMQTAIANFVKNPTQSPIPSWPAFQASSDVATLAKLAYSGNVGLDNVVEAVPSNVFDSACVALWDSVLTINSPA